MSKIRWDYNSQHTSHKIVASVAAHSTALNLCARVSVDARDADAGVYLVMSARHFYGDQHQLTPIEMSTGKMAATFTVPVHRNSSFPGSGTISSW